VQANSKQKSVGRRSVPLDDVIMDPLGQSGESEKIFDIEMDFYRNSSAAGKECDRLLL
jgi:hypothetical protein